MYVYKKYICSICSIKVNSPLMIKTKTMETLWIIFVVMAIVCFIGAAVCQQIILNKRKQNKEAKHAVCLNGEPLLLTNDEALDIINRMGADDTLITIKAINITPINITRMVHINGVIKYSNGLPKFNGGRIKYSYYTPNDKNDYPVIDKDRIFIKDIVVEEPIRNSADCPHNGEIIKRIEDSIYVCKLCGEPMPIMSSK